ncbi:bZIP transcription factor [Aspergillus mulundensis]|uniref:BZIP domain-containing protein n=1 Tax=Aspergillus mulundensis TaxID=1810919 RepID=A0A3D8QJ83_9EURO|nr:hypothetical protein DSM5745_10479 [Aspergillus mulundensis]RDW61807.1 hypothetical protein DSM5745_10479 [Aspergillus mulundensis]
MSYPNSPVADDASSSSDPAIRRREQVRRAQQTYRQRKEDYIKSLENEVLHLRTARSDLTAETKKLTAEVQWLRQVIERNVISLPPTPVFDVHVSSRRDDLDSPPEPELEPGPTATVCVHQDVHYNKRFVVLDDALNGNRNGSGSGSLSQSQSPGSVQHGPGWQDGQCDVVTGMNFILRTVPRPRPLGPGHQHRPRRMRKRMRAPGRPRPNPNRVSLPPLRRILVAVAVAVAVWKWRRRTPQCIEEDAQQAPRAILASYHCRRTDRNPGVGISMPESGGRRSRDGRDYGSCAEVGGGC